MRIAAILMLLFTSLGFVPSVAELLFEELHSEHHEDIEHECDGECPDCSFHAQTAGIIAGSVETVVSCSQRVHFASPMVMAPRAGFTVRLERPPAA